MRTVRIGSPGSRTAPASRRLFPRPWGYPPLTSTAAPAGIALVHAVLVGRIADDLPFLHRGHMVGVDAQGHAVLLLKV